VRTGLEFVNVKPGGTLSNRKGFKRLIQISGIPLYSQIPQAQYELYEYCELEARGSVSIRIKPWTKALESLKRNCQSSTTANYYTKYCTAFICVITVMFK
jgi:hypothetical protein